MKETGLKAGALLEFTRIAESSCHGILDQVIDVTVLAASAARQFSKGRRQLNHPRLKTGVLLRASCLQISSGETSQSTVAETVPTGRLGFRQGTVANNDGG
jgi:hypothetical protein